MSKSRLITVVGSLILVVILIAGWFLLLSPRLEKASDLRSQREAVASENVTTKATIDDLEKKKANIGEAQADAELLAGKFPSTAAEAELFALIRKAASDAGLPEKNVTDLTPGIPALASTDGSVALPADQAAPAEGEASDPNAAPAAGTDAAAGGEKAAAPAAQLATMSLDLSVTGSQAQVIRFLGELENMDRAILIETVSFGDGEKGSGSATISGKMFLLPALVDPTKPVEGDAAATETAPTETPAP